MLLPHEYLLADIAPVDVPSVKPTGPYLPLLFLSLLLPLPLFSLPPSLFFDIQTYDSAEHYFNTYTRLLREDCFFEMRQGISNMLEGKTTQMNSFLNIRFSGIHFLRRGRGVCYCLQFSPLRFVKNWKETSQLQYLFSPSLLTPIICFLLLTAAPRSTCD